MQVLWQRESKYNQIHYDSLTQNVISWITLQVFSLLMYYDIFNWLVNGLLCHINRVWPWRVGPYLEGVSGGGCFSSESPFLIPLYSQFYIYICKSHTLNWRNKRTQYNRPPTIAGLDWTGLDSSGMDWKILSATQTPNSIGLGWKMSSKNKYNFVALSLQLVREEWNTKCTWNSHRL